MSTIESDVEIGASSVGSPSLFTATEGYGMAAAGVGSAASAGYGSSGSGLVASTTEYGGSSSGTGNAELRAESLRTFRITAANHARERGINAVTSDWNLVSVAEEAGVNLFQHTRDADFLASIWIAFLTVMKEHFPADRHKFPNVDAFLEAYPEFLHTPAEEQTNLFNTANWMAVLFTMIPAAKNKGLVLQVIPQVVEGGHVKYITGSGQTEATTNRVHIYEKEGHIVVAHRAGARSSYKKKNAKKQSTKKAPAPVTAVFRRPRSGSESSVARRRELHRMADPSGEHPGARRPRSGTGSSSTDGEFDDNHFGEGMDDEAEGGEGSDEDGAAGGGDYSIAEEDDEASDFADVLQLLRNTAAEGRGRGGMALQQPPAPDFYASVSSSGLISPDSPGLGLSNAAPVPLERVNSWGGMGPLQRYSSTEFPDQPAFPPEHPSYHPVVDQLGVAVMGGEDADLFFQPGKKG